MPSALHRDDTSWLVYSADQLDHSKKRVRRYPFRERGDKTAVHEAIRKDLNLSSTESVSAALHGYSVDAEGQFVRD